MRLLNYMLIKLTISLITGIVLAHFLSFDFNAVLYITIGFLFLICIYTLSFKNKIDRSPCFGILSYCTLIAIGILTYQINIEHLKSNHYSNFQNNDNSPENLVLKIEDKLKPNTFYDRYFVSVNTINTHHVLGRLLVNIKKDSSSINLAIDDLFFTSAQLEDVSKPRNPHQFDYSAYLKLKNIKHQIFISNTDFLALSSSKTTIYGYADLLRTTINTQLTKAGFTPNSLSIINALLLGQRQHIDPTLYNNYINSGTIHILAVSGLHVGVLLWILNFLFKPILYIKYGNYLKPALLVISLWAFAIIAGLSPSVTRAVTMFSIISLAMHLKRSTNIYNTLVISAFIILLFKPVFLFDVGFQLSYLAVFAIVSIQPFLYKLWVPKFIITNKLWQIFTVTLAAQAGVAPISLYYFHQFPGLFFISNVVVIPFLGLILSIGLLVITLALLDVIPDVLVITYSFIIDSLNAFIAWIAQFEDFLFRDISFSILQVIFCYMLCITTVQFYTFKSFKWLRLTFICCIIFQISLIGIDYYTKDDAFIVFNKSRFSIIGQKRNAQFSVHHNLDTLGLKTDNVIRNYKVGEAVSAIKSGGIQQFYQYKENRILVVDSLGVYKGLSFKPQFILLRNSPRLNLNRLIDSLKPQKIIADASNYKSYVKRWEGTCKAKKIPFHYTNKKGAFVLK